MAEFDSRQDQWQGWQVHHPPADEESIQSFLASCPHKLPEAYLALIRSVNGGEGDLEIDPFWFQLWPIEKVLEMNELYSVAEFHPGYFAFASSGGGVLLAFDVREAEKSRVYGIPLDSPDPADIAVVSETFSEFANAVGRPAPDI